MGVLEVYRFPNYKCDRPRWRNLLKQQLWDAYNSHSCCFFGNLHTLSLQGMQNISGFVTESILTGYRFLLAVYVRLEHLAFRAKLHITHVT